MNAESKTFMERISDLQNEYYSNFGKNMLFKTKQKQDCANLVADKMGNDEMIENTIFHIPKTNKVFFDYPVFKLYANQNNYDIIISKIISSFDANIKKYGCYESHINLNSFSISALERYKPIIIKFCANYLNNNPRYTDNLDRLYIYNTPSMIDMLINIVSPSVNTDVLKKIVFVNKKDSEKLILNLLTNNVETKQTI
jgi:hypothetical protein